jgi:disulfide bond formation protein DsbB
MQTLSSVLALVAGTGAIAIVVAALVGERVPAIAAIARRLHRRRTEWTLAIAGVSTVGSLYFSEVADYIPCRLCWFQRIFMYPIAVIALVALIRRDRVSHVYTVPLAAIGSVIALYHYLIETGVFEDSESCLAIGMSCAAVWFEGFGFVTLSFMALCGFAAIIALNLVSPPGGTNPPEELS